MGRGGGGGGRIMLSTPVWMNISTNEGHRDGSTLGIWGNEYKLVAVRAASLYLIFIYFLPC